MSTSSRYRLHAMTLVMHLIEIRIAEEDHGKNIMQGLDEFVLMNTEPCFWPGQYS
jgi:hypothetical protein